MGSFGSINSGSIVWLGVAAAVVTVFALIAMGKKKDLRDQNRQLDNAIAWLRQTINRYNRALDLFEAVCNDKLKEVRAVADPECAERIINIERSFDEERDKALSYIKRYNVSNLKADPYEMRQGLGMAEAHVAEMESCIELVKTLKPERRDYERTYYQEEREREYEDTVHENKTGSLSYFTGCTTKAQVEKRYRALVKIYHPDSGAGDEESFKQIKAEYDQLYSKIAE